MSDQSGSKNRKRTPTGSPQTGEPLYIAIGKLRRTHGVLGEILMDILTDFPERFNVGSQVFVGTRHVSYTVRSFRFNRNTGLIAFDGLDDCDEASILRNQMVFGLTEDAPRLAEGEFYHHEILGVKVVDEAGKLIGTLSEILQTGANDVYVVKSENGKEILLPAIKSVVLSIDLAENKMVVRPPEWD